MSVAASHSVVVQLCLWSFDMCKREGASSTKAALITDADATQSYIDSALEPLLASLAGAENVLIEVINEPEWCVAGDDCTADECVPLADMQRFVSSHAIAAHAAGLKVTVGSASLKWNSDGGSGLANYWSDAALQAAAPEGADASAAHLDLYNIHYCASTNMTSRNQ